MDRTTLIRLAANRSRTLGELRSSSAAVYDEVAREIGEKRKQLLVEALSTSSPAVVEAVGKLDAADLASGSLSEAAKRIFRSTGADEKAQAEALKRLSYASKLDPGEAQLDVSVEKNPALARALAKADLLGFAGRAGVRAEAVDQLIEKSDGLDQVGDGVLAELVGAKKMTQDEANRLGLRLGLHHLSNGAPAVAHALAGAQFAALKGQIKDVRDVLHLSPDDIVKALQGQALDPGQTAQQVASEIRKRVVDRFPAEALSLRLAPPEKTWLLPRLRHAGKLLEKNSGRFGVDFAALDRSGTTAAEQPGAARAYQELVQLSRRYAGLGLAEMIGSGGNAQAIVNAVNARIGLLDKVVAQNPDVEFLALDYSSDAGDVKGLKMNGLAEGEQRAVMAHFKARQRVYAVAGEPDDVATLLEAGYDSALSIASERFDMFHGRSGLTKEKARPIYERATETLSGLSATFGGVIDLVKGGFDRMPVGNVDEDVSDRLRGIEGYAELFGPQDNCNCRDCASILSPAAYFVDLMYFVEQHVLSPVFAGAKATHALNLKVRRPDLWTLDLTCGNTNSLVPTLDVINEVLESYIAKRLNPAIDLGNRPEVRDQVYGHALAETKTSFSMPFVLAARTVDAYVEPFEVTRAGILRTLGAPTARATAASLGMAKEVYDCVVTPETGLSFLRRLYRIDFVADGAGARFNVDVQDFLRATGISHEQLERLVESRFVTNAGASGVTLRSEKSSPSSVQNDVERIVGLDANVLDRMHRLLRLWRHTDWTIPELDLVLQQRVNGAPVVNDAALADVVAVRGLHRRFGVPVDVACALWSDIPRREIVDGQRSLFDRLFNNRPYAQTEGALPKGTTKFIVPAFLTTAAPANDNTLQRLLLGLQVDDSGLAAVATGLASVLGCNPTAPAEANRGFNLTGSNLTLLYRHSKLAKLLNRPVGDLLRLVRLAGIANGVVGSLADLQKVLAFEEWLRASGLSLDDVCYILGSAVVDANQYPSPSTITTSLIDGIRKDNALVFADTVLAFIPGITEEMSRRIFAQNAVLFDVLPDGTRRLKATAETSASITLPAGLAGSLVANVQAAVMKYHTANVLPVRLAALLGVATEKLAAIAAMSNIDLGRTGVAHALHGGSRAPLQAAITQLTRLATLFRAELYTPSRLAFVGGHPSLFGVNAFPSLDVKAIQSITSYRDLIAATEAGLGIAADPQAVEECLVAFTPAGKFAAAESARLAAALAVEPAVASLLPSAVALNNNALQSLATLADAVDLMRRSGLDAPTLRLLASDSAADLARAAEALVSALNRKYSAEGEAQKWLEPKDDRLRSLKRDALADYIIRDSAGRFATLDDLYNYFLLDVQLQGCARTSRVVAAVSSVRSYVQRILLNLEQDERPTGDPHHVLVTPDSIPANEWTWRKNYRVWEANRKVFLWPENYLEPGLRDDKTPLFRALEDGLLQQDMTEQNVLDAYGEYLSGFEAASNVTIAGAYHEFHDITERDVLHVFGATPDDPPTYYYWTISNLYYSRVKPERRLSYSARTKLDVSIPVRKVTPVVYLGRLFVFWTEIQTSSLTQLKDGESTFDGYKHQVRIKYVSLRLDGRWTAPQEIAIDERSQFKNKGIVIDHLVGKGTPTENVPWHSTDYKAHTEYQEGYTLEGPHWERVSCEPLGDRLVIGVCGLRETALVDLFDRRLRSLGQKPGLPQEWFISRRVLHIGHDGTRKLYAPLSLPWYLSSTWVVSPSGYQQALADIRGVRAFLTGWGYRNSTLDELMRFLSLDDQLRGQPLARVRDGQAVASPVTGAPGGAGLIIAAGSDALHVTADPRASDSWLGTRLGTTLTHKLSRTLFMGGIEQLLDIATQKYLGEGPHLLDDARSLTLIGTVGSIDFDGPLGVYYREIFLHIPLLIANALNGRQNYQSAQSWYHYIFDPTASLDVDISLDNLDERQRKKALRDRVWRYIKFRDLTPPKLRDILTDDAAIEAYRNDPFNPHAIARLRISAYQKSVVMKYVSNLLDWGDSLFEQFTTESVNEATVLYVMASEILGRRPADVGDCGNAGMHPRTYERIRPSIARGSEFLAEMESQVWIGPKAKRYGRNGHEQSQYVKYMRAGNDVALARMEAQMRDGVPSELTEGASGTKGLQVAHMKLRAERGAMVSGTGARNGMTTSSIAPETAVSMIKAGLDPTPSRQLDWKRTRAGGWTLSTDHAKAVVVNDAILVNDFQRAGGFGWSVIRQLGPVFCVPRNKDLDRLWNRTEDRLYKIRHCLDIIGDRRDLALFAPEIDPRLLVRARAQGLSIEDVLGAGSGNLPPYRFAYLIEKAKQYVSAVQSLGVQLLAAMEKRDVEQLAQLRNTQQLNMLNLITRLREWELQIATDAVEQLNRQKAAVEYRRDYYAGLLDTDLLPWERTEQALRHGSSAFYVLGATLGGTAGVLSLLPQIGSPFAMKYGGHELGNSLKGWSTMFSDTAKVMDVLAASAGLEAGFERRREGWQHQQKLADHELKQIEKQLSAADLRVQIAQRSSDLHKASIEEQDEIIQFFNEKFSNLSLYVWLSTSLLRLYQQSFNSAQNMAKLAERAYRFERDDDSATLLDVSYWDAQHSGLLAGEHLMADLMEMERRFVETNYRSLEIDQAFSVLQLSPQALLALRETGGCEVSIPEIAFDLYYPGHYRRRIRAVRLTIPCVTGPYTNVAATLTLKNSRIRKEPRAGDANLVEVPLRHTPSVATSTAQGDSGVFDFSFRDERYMPFEGAGAVSTWTISLPKNFRPFNYDTITDVILHISYTALADGVLRETVENASAAVEGSITKALSNVPLARAISLRQEFSSAFQRAISSPAGTQVQLDIDERYLPFFLRGRAITLSRVLLLVHPGDGASGRRFAVKLSDQSYGAFASSPVFEGYLQADVASAFVAGLTGHHVFSIENGGDLAPASGPGVIAVCSAKKLVDLVLYVEVKL